jgi:hypothetical protein
MGACLPVGRGAAGQGAYTRGRPRVLENASGHAHALGGEVAEVPAEQILLRHRAHVDLIDAHAPRLSAAVALQLAQAEDEEILRAVGVAVGVGGAGLEILGMRA